MEAFAAVETRHIPPAENAAVQRLRAAGAMVELDDSKKKKKNTIVHAATPAAGSQTGSRRGYHGYGLKPGVIVITSKTRSAPNGWRRLCGQRSPPVFLNEEPAEGNQVNCRQGPPGGKMEAHAITCPTILGSSGMMT